jgi:hypothetical protein
MAAGCAGYYCCCGCRNSCKVQRKLVRTALTHADQTGQSHARHGTPGRVAACSGAGELPLVHIPAGGGQCRLAERLANGGRAAAQPASQPASQPAAFCSSQPQATRPASRRHIGSCQGARVVTHPLPRTRTSRRPSVARLLMVRPPASSRRRRLAVTVPPSACCCSSSNRLASSVGPISLPL